MDSIILNLKQEADKTLQYLKDDLGGLRTGRVSPALVEGLLIEAYQGQTKMKLMEMAAITTSDAQTLHIQPFDVSTIKDIEKSIFKSPLGLNPIVSGTKILIKIPPMNQEQREKILKIVNQKIEEKRTYLRTSRDNARKRVKNLLEKKEITEDDKYRLEKEIDKAIQSYNEMIQAVKERKEKEIMEV